jgi:hypothetical protein
MATLATLSVLAPKISRRTSKFLARQLSNSLLIRVHNFPLSSFPAITTTRKSLLCHLLGHACRGIKKAVSRLFCSFTVS